MRLAIEARDLIWDSVVEMNDSAHSGSEEVLSVSGGLPLVPGRADRFQLSGRPFEFA